MTAVAIGEGVLAAHALLRRLRQRRIVEKHMVENGEAFEVRTPDGETVICKPVGEGYPSDGNPKPHQSKPSQMGLAG